MFNVKANVHQLIQFKLVLISFKRKYIIFILSIIKKGDKMSIVTNKS
jgi:hypothetical protein